ncbi:ATP-binding protein [Methanococcus voltae]|uniref:ATPase AAA-type core domain-containing protein n=1 Tax=Methanococcus voltae (strain ATCC BAA-1334 / A3) TaxID=456320 RepID=D7DRB2_METV3|nr:ATP-binding protein [Methanococcus voltae]MCS3901049.1 hypothetical protein [Methanococcus voltae]
MGRKPLDPKAIKKKLEEHEAGTIKLPYSTLQRYKNTLDKQDLKEKDEEYKQNIDLDDELNNIDLNSEYVNYYDIIDFKNPFSMCVFGIKRQGKTTLLKHMAYSNQKDVLIYDLVHNFNNFGKRCYQAKETQFPDSALEFQRFYSSIYNKLNKNRENPILLLIDECDKIAPNNSRMPGGLAELNDLHRHAKFNTSFVCVARRPATLNTNLKEIADYIIFFKLTGKNDKSFLNDLHKDLYNAVESLNAEEHEFIIYDMPMSKIYKSKLDLNINFKK